jgi:hypothetical protein
MTTIDLKAEQQASLSRARYRYSVAAKFFFLRNGFGYWA